MTRQQFIENLKEELEFEEELTEGTFFKESAEWDSMAALVLVGFVSQNFGVDLKAEDIEKLSTVSSLMDRIGQDKFS